MREHELDFSSQCPDVMPNEYPWDNLEYRLTHKRPKRTTSVDQRHRAKLQADDKQEILFQ